MNVSSMRAQLRIGRRDSLRSKGRSALIVLMIVFPIMAITIADVNARTDQKTPAQQLERQLGAADVKLTFVGISTNSSLGQIPTGLNYMSFDKPGAKPGDGAGTQLVSPDLSTALPHTQAAVTDTRSNIQIKTAAGLGSVDFREFDYANPAVKGLLKQRSGRPPANRNEVVVGEGFKNFTGLGVGNTVSLTASKQSFTIVGTVRDVDDLKNNDIVALPGSLGAEPTAENSDPRNVTYVKTSTSVTWEQIRRLNDKGVLVVNKSMLVNSPPRSEVPFYEMQPRSSANVGTVLNMVGLVSLIAGLATLEICLLAGAAFAVGVRRQQRTLALIAATGGTARQVAGTVLATAVVLGGVAAILGLAGGAALITVLKPVLERIAGFEMSALDFHPLDLAGIAGFALFAAVASALLPARLASKMDVVAALAGRRAGGRVSRNTWVLGLMFAIVGAACAVYASVSRSPSLILVGATVFEVGLIFVIPALLTQIGRIGVHLPIAPRLALRDAVRNRTRTAPVVAAVMAAVAGAVATSMYVNVQEVNAREDYVPFARQGQVLAGVADGAPGSLTGGATKEEVERALRADLPVTQLVTLNHFKSNDCAQEDFACRSSSQSELSVKRSPQNECAPTSAASISIDPRCAGHGYSTDEGGIVMADETALHMLTGTDSGAALKTLRDGGALVSNRLDLDNGKVHLQQTEYGSNGDTHVINSWTLPAAVFENAPKNVPSVLMTNTTARRLGIATTPTALLSDTSRMTTDAEEQRATADLSKLDFRGFFTVERGYKSTSPLTLLVLAIATGILALFASLVATGLSLADGQADHATLAAVGAGSGIRRRLSMLQAATIALLGIGLGVISGAIPGAAAAWVTRYGSGPVRIHHAVPWGDVVPWTTLGVLVIGIPITVALLAGVFTRSRIALAHRIN